MYNWRALYDTYERFEKRLDYVDCFKEKLKEFEKTGNTYRLADALNTYFIWSYTKYEIDFCDAHEELMQGNFGPNAQFILGKIKEFLTPPIKEEELWI